MVIYTKKGLYHKEKGEVSGDVIRCMDNGEYAIIVLADGASSCSRGAEGADRISSKAIEIVQNQYGYSYLLPDNWAEILINNLVNYLHEISVRQEIPFKEYSSTLMVILIDRKRNLLHYCNIGDGLVIGIKDQKCPIICMPQGDGTGCPMITTDGVKRIIDAGNTNLDSINSIFVCSDGTWRLMYEHSTMKPEIKEKLISGKYEEFWRIVKSSCSIDDCSFGVVDVR